MFLVNYAMVALTKELFFSVSFVSFFMFWCGWAKTGLPSSVYYGFTENSLITGSFSPSNAGSFSLPVSLLFALLPVSLHELGH